MGMKNCQKHCERYDLFLMNRSFFESERASHERITHVALFQRALRAICSRHSFVKAKESHLLMVSIGYSVLKSLGSESLMVTI